MIPKLEVHGVSYSYHSADGETLALSNISFSVDSGQFWAIVGPSGCGKSTLLSLLCGLLKPDQGEILLDGLPLSATWHPLATCCKRITCLSGAASSPMSPWVLKSENSWTTNPARS